MLLKWQGDSVAKGVTEVLLQSFQFLSFFGTFGVAFSAVILLIEFSSRRINASPLERDTGRGGHYRAFLD